MADTLSLRADVACPGGGRLLISAFPGVDHWAPGAGAIDPRVQAATLAALAARRAARLIVLAEEHDLAPGAFAALTARAKAVGLALDLRPIEDYGVPDGEFLARWHHDRAALLATLAAGGTLALCCHHGAGRSGLVAALLLIEAAGMTGDSAMAHIRAVHPAAVETPQQEGWLRRYPALF